MKLIDDDQFPASIDDQYLPSTSSGRGPTSLDRSTRNKINPRSNPKTIQQQTSSSSSSSSTSSSSSDLDDLIAYYTSFILHQIIILLFVIFFLYTLL